MTTSDSTGPGLDPADWDDARRTAHALLDACLDHMRDAADRPWRRPDDAAVTALRADLPRVGIGHAALAEALVRDVMPFATGNTHPRFFGWVHGTGQFEAFLADMVASAMNSNCGGRDHGATHVERAVIDWSARIFGFPETAGGVLTAGTSAATALCLAAARQAVLGPDVRRTGNAGAPLVGYASAGTHSAVRKAFELLGLGAAALRDVPLDANGQGDVAVLSRMIAGDRAAGRKPFLVVGTAGSVDTGRFDDLAALAPLAERERLWFHVDGAFGAWVRIAGEPWAALVKGIERADSLAFDFHKWPYVQYDCGAALVRDGAGLHATFATRPAYLALQEAGLGGGDPWFCDFGIDLSRGFRALKVWSVLRAHGLDRLGQAIAANCRQAARMGDLVQASGLFALAAPVKANVCCFRGIDPASDRLLAGLAADMQLAGEAVLSTTTVDGRPALRAAIVNHRTRDEDIVETVRIAGERLRQATA